MGPSSPILHKIGRIYTMYAYTRLPACMKKSPREMNHVNKTLKYSSIPFLIFSNLVIESIGYCIKKESTSIVLDM